MGPFVLPQPGITGRHLQQECGAAASVRAGIPHSFKCAAAAVQLLSHPLLSHPQTHPMGVRTFYHTPFLSPLPHLSNPQTHLVGVRTSYHTPWFITSPLGPLRTALYHPGYARFHPPHRIPHPVIIFLNPKILSLGCVILCQLRYSNYPPWCVSTRTLCLHTYILMKRFTSAGLPSHNWRLSHSSSTKGLTVKNNLRA